MKAKIVLSAAGIAVTLMFVLSVSSARAEQPSPIGETVWPAEAERVEAGEEGDQDVFSHTTGTGAMSKNSDDTTYIDATWDAFKVWQPNFRDRNGDDADQTVETEDGLVWMSAEPSLPDRGE